MIVIKNEWIIHFDVDDTLVMLGDKIYEPGDGKIRFEDPHDSTVLYLKPHSRHIKLLKDFKSRGFHITVWSGGGHDWAETVIKTLELENYVDIVMTKNTKFIDDLPATEVLGSRIYLEDHND